jgi:YopX protein
MRELKFRTWDTEAKLFYFYRIEQASIIVWEDIAPSLVGYVPNLQPAQQFTGLKDMNGKDIYDGDILKADDQQQPFVVKWRCAKFLIERQMRPDFGDKDYGWVIADLTDSHYFDGDETVEGTTVIGNA